MFALKKTNRVNQQFSLYDTRSSPSRTPIMFGEGESGSANGAEGGNKGRSKYVRGSWQDNLFASADQNGNLRVRTSRHRIVRQGRFRLTHGCPPPTDLGRPASQVVPHGASAFDTRVVCGNADSSSLGLQIEIQAAATAHRQVILDGDNLLDLTGDALFVRKWRLL